MTLEELEKESQNARVEYQKYYDAMRRYEGIVLYLDKKIQELKQSGLDE